MGDPKEYRCEIEIHKWKIEPLGLRVLANTPDTTPETNRSTHRHVMCPFTTPNHPGTPPMLITDIFKPCLSFCQQINNTFKDGLQV